eukprot:TRINITY_DN62263_c0_g1_i1.p1 TRINITY_DN62263_c0_g1~~TRINITY_DN62263_c0_g1_i1.p1  ORF type:complete len:420 (-),score=79.67 TRINITY_DN62263_c0_g1_i1:40-1260(-)
MAPKRRRGRPAPARSASVPVRGVRRWRLQGKQRNPWASRGAVHHQPPAQQSGPTHGPSQASSGSRVNPADLLTALAGQYRDRQGRPCGSGSSPAQLVAATKPSEVTAKSAALGRDSGRSQQARRGPDGQQLVACQREASQPARAVVPAVSTLAALATERRSKELLAVPEAQAGPRRVKCPREVQVCLDCNDRDRGFVRSVTASTMEQVPELRRKLWELKARAKFRFTYAEVEEELQLLRQQFASRGPKRKAALPDEGDEPRPLPDIASRAARRSSGSAPRLVHSRPAGDAQDQVDPEASEAEPVPVEAKRRKRARRRAAGSVKAQSLKEQGKGLFAKKQASPQLEALIRRKTVNHCEMMKFVWEYIKENDLQNGKMIRPDAMLAAICPEREFQQWKLARFLKHHLQ